MIRFYCDHCGVETEVHGSHRITGNGSLSGSPAIEVIIGKRTLTGTNWNHGQFCKRCTVRAVIQAAGLSDVFVEKEGA